ncbi:MAG TPA: lysylphosphatidylglycerol synthase domain-containing protein, partial [Candidatus Brocadiia bacterium]|nr:lysylphosphatidylglycerol synthase domain-containing protein [Candidatus Brocadiia bacterium]
MSQQRGASPKRLARFSLSALVAVAVLLALCFKTQTKLSSVFDKVLEVNRFLLLCAFLFSAFVHIVVGALKWRLILKWSGCKTTFVETLFVRMGSDPLRAALPFKSGELGNLAYYWRTGRMTFAESVSWVAFDKALNVAGTLFWLVAGLGILGAQRAPDALRGRWEVVALGSALTLACVAALGAPVMSRRLRWALVRLCGRVNAKVRRFGEGTLSVFEKISPAGKAWLGA